MKIKTYNSDLCIESVVEKIVEDLTKEIPEKIICNFTSIKKWKFYDPLENSFLEFMSKPISRSKSYIAPFDYKEIVGDDWAYYSNINKLIILIKLCNNLNVDFQWNIPDLEKEDEQWLNSLKK